MAVDALSPDEELQRAERARQYLDDPFIAEWFADVSRQLMSAVDDAKDEKQAFRAVTAVQVFGVLRRHFTSAIETGKLARIQIEQKRRFGVF